MENGRVGVYRCGNDFHPAQNNSTEISNSLAYIQYVVLNELKGVNNFLRNLGAFEESHDKNIRTRIEKYSIPFNHDPSQMTKLFLLRFIYHLVYW